MNTDIVPPSPSPAAPPAPAPMPVDDVKPAPAPQPAPQTPDAVKEELAKAKDTPKPTAPKVKKEGGPTAAIVATVVIVLGLAALATYAYLQTK